ncbi:sensor domain-containing protein [Marinobacter salicampi]|uniref:sensor domain-containing protein n=1 Tax=Marinobacter salicampi TaxID=435907 RepID=UPI0014083926|nr:EAL domain-containing protein [Marinobacter salicampi]
MDDVRTLSSDQRFRLLANSASSHAMLITDPQGRIVEWTQGAEQMLGWTKAEVLEQSCVFIFTPEDKASGFPQADVAEALRSGFAETRRRFVRKDGQQVLADGTTYPLFAPDGSHLGFGKMLREARGGLNPDRKDTLRDPLADHAQLEAVLEAAVPVGILLSNSKGGLIETAPSEVTLFGDQQSPAWCIDQLQDWKGWWADGSSRHGQRLKPSEWPLARALAGEESPHATIELESIDEPPVRRTVLASAMPLRDSQDSIVGGIAAVTDISAWIQTEGALRETAARLQFILDAAEIGDWDLDLKNDVARRSVRHDLCFGYKEPIPDWGFDIFIEHVHPDDRLRVKRAFELAIQNVDDWHCECRVIWPDGSVHWIAAHGSVYGNEGSPTRMAGIVYDITKRKHAEKELRHAALHDLLTGLPNRAMLFEYANHLLPRYGRNAQQAAVLFLDLDRFKRINDTHGHEIGDSMLKEVARRLLQVLRSEDLVVRLGGDEFLILLQDIERPETAAEVAGQLVEEISKPFSSSNLTLSLSTSIGISLFPQDGHDIDTLVSHADMAMYVAKEAGRNNYSFYSVGLAAETRYVQFIEQQLRIAVNTSDFHLVYQPVRDLQTDRIVSVEALLRWGADEVGPEEFIPIAEATGLINSIGRWLLEEACIQHKTWIQNGLPPIPIALNVSAVEFRDRNFVSRFKETIESHGIEANAIQLELTETAVMDDPEHTVAMLTQLDGFGFTILLDDFGTGHSSLAYLTRLPLCKVKIDKSFITGVGDSIANRAVTDAMTALATTLGLEVVVEGVESEAVLEYVRSLGCMQGQGYYLGNPMSGSSFEEWYKQHVPQPLTAE